MNLRNSLVVRSVLAFLAASIFSSAQGALIDVDFNGPSTDTQSGGAVIGNSGDAWNGIGGNSNTGVALVDATGTPIAATLDFTSTTGADVGTSSTFSATSPVYPLMRDLLISVGSTDVETVTVHGLVPGNYDLYLYSNSDNPAIAQARVTAFTANGASGTAGPNNLSGALTAGVNYVVLSLKVAGSGPSAGLLDITYTNSNTADNIGQLNGFQLVPVPEPASSVLLGPATMILLIAARRRRA